MKQFIGMAIGVIALMVFGSCASAKSDKAVDAAHNTRNSVDWAGKYTGMIPAADGPGIDVIIELRDDETFFLSYVYIDRDPEPYIVEGTFTWDDTGSRVILDNDEVPPHYRVGENVLIQLDMEGNPFTGDFADMYILRKTIRE